MVTMVILHAYHFKFSINVNIVTTLHNVVLIAITPLETPPRLQMIFNQ